MPRGPGGPTPIVSVPARPSRGRVVARIALLVGIVVIVFGLVLPRIVDIDQVLAALGTLTPSQLGVLAVATGVAYVMNAAPIRVLMPAISWPRAVGADLDDRRRDVSAPLALGRKLALPHLASGRAHCRDVPVERGFGLGVDNRADIGGQISRIADHQRLERAADHCQRGVGDIVLQVQHSQRAAALAGALER